MHEAAHLKILSIGFCLLKMKVIGLTDNTSTILDMRLKISKFLIEKGTHGSKTMIEAEWGQLIPWRLLKNQVDAANCWECDLAGQPWKHRWPLCYLITLPRLNELSVFSPGAVRLQVDRMQGKMMAECKVTRSAEQTEGTQCQAH